MHELGVFGEMPAMPRLAEVLCHIDEINYGTAQSHGCCPAVAAMIGRTVLHGISDQFLKGIPQLK